MINLFKRKPKLKDDPNPWLGIEHSHNWLEANGGTEYVCGDCGYRLDAGSNLPDKLILN